MKSLRLPVFALGLLLAHGTLDAQSPVTRPDATIFALQTDAFSLQGTFNHTFESDFTNEALGSQSATTYGVVGTLPIRLTGSLRLLTGVAYERFDFGGSDTPLLPDTMQSVSGVIGLEYLVNGRPAVFVRASPGVYFIDSASSDSFDIPVVAAGAWRFTDSFILLYGATYAGFRDTPVLPVLGFLWNITDEIDLNLTFPRPNLTYKFSDSLHFSVVGEYRGLSVHTAGDVPDPTFRDTELSYRELAAGVAAAYLFTEDHRVQVSAGYTFRRRFEYDSPGRTFRTEGAPYVGVSFQGKF